MQLIHRHKPAVLLALIVAVVVALGMMFIWHDPVADEARAERYGENLASTLAAQGMEAMMGPDRLHLSVLVNRMATLPGVGEARFLDANRAVLSESGRAASSSALTYTAPILIGGITSGYAQITLQASAFAPQVSTAQILASVLLILCMPLVAMMIGEWPARRRPIPVVEFPDDDQPTGPSWLMLVNLYNQLAYPSESRRAVFERTREQAEQVAHLYQGRARSVTGSGVAIEFAESEDVAFKAVCASFLLLRVLATQQPDAEYRIALHAGPEASAEAETLADAALLAALAKEGTLISTDAFHATLEKADRLLSETFEHAMLEDVDIATGTAHTIVRLSEKHDDLLAQQVRALLRSEAEQISQAS